MFCPIFAFWSQRRSWFNCDQEHKTSRRTEKWNFCSLEMKIHVHKFELLEEEGDGKKRNNKNQIPDNCKHPFWYETSYIANKNITRVCTRKKNNNKQTLTYDRYAQMQLQSQQSSFIIIILNSQSPTRVTMLAPHRLRVDLIFPKTSC